DFDLDGTHTVGIEQTRSMYEGTRRNANAVMLKDRNISVCVMRKGEMRRGGMSIIGHWGGRKIFRFGGVQDASKRRAVDVTAACRPEKWDLFCRGIKRIHGRVLLSRCALSISYT